MIIGKWKDCWKNTTTNEEFVIEGNNQIQNTFGIMQARLMRGLPLTPAYAIYLAFGRGDPSWDFSIYQQSYDQTTLYNEIYRKGVSEQVRTTETNYDELSTFYYIDPDTYEGSVSATNAIEAKVFVPEGVADGIHREFGMFGITATEAKDTGYMINWVNIPAFDKTGHELTRTIRLIFSKR